MKNGIQIQQESNAITSINPLDASPTVFKAGLTRRKTNRDALMEWIRASLVEGRDYGSILINGKASKSSLFKPGAEKIAGMLGLTAIFPNLSRYEDAAMNGKPINAIILKCNLVNAIGDVIGQGVGARFVEQQDKGDLNKSLKMAIKSAMIDATLRCAGLSEIFTQDIEDNKSPVNINDADPATEKQMSTVQALLDNDLVTQEEKDKVQDILAEGLTKGKAKEILEYFYGESVRVNGSWQNKTPGVLGERRN